MLTVRQSPYWLLSDILVVFLCCTVTGCGGESRDRSPSPVANSIEPKQPKPPSFAQLRAESPSQLTRRGSAPSPFRQETPPEGVHQVVYPSGDLQLKAWFALPQNDRQFHPAVVYLHSGYAFGASDWEEARVFLDAGFAVLTPMLRGENGNPGSFELFWGEVDDAAAAAEWLAGQPRIDRERIFTFGHSIGGGISSLLALMGDEVPIRHGGSCGGLYPPEVFAEWSEIAPFDTSNPTECELRSLVCNLASMQRDHHAYVGIADPLAAVDYNLYGSRVHLKLIVGDHLSSLAPAVADYARLIHGEVFGDSHPLPATLQPLHWKHSDTVPSASVIADAEDPELWNLEADPFPGTLAHFRDSVHCPITIVTENMDYVNDRGDFAFPYSFQPIAKLTSPKRDGSQTSKLIDLSTMKVIASPEGAEFETLLNNSYGFDDGRARFFFRWPGTKEALREPPGDVEEVRSGVYAVSPGKRYVAGFAASGELLVWDVATREVVGRTRVPDLVGLDDNQFQVAEVGFAPDGAEFAAVLGTSGINFWLLNWHWESGRITAYHPMAKWLRHTGTTRQHQYQLQFLEDGQGWLVGYGTMIIDREGLRYRSIEDSLFHYRYPGSHLRLIAGNRAIGIVQDRSSLFKQSIHTFKLRRDDNGWHSPLISF